MRARFLSMPASLKALQAQVNRGQPVVIAFAETLELHESPVLEAIRAELRGLGAALMLIARGQAFVFRPDDELDLYGTSVELDASAVQELRRLYGLTSLGAFEQELALVLVAGNGGIVATHSLSAADGLGALADALRAAGRQAMAPQACTLSRREVVLASLVGAFALLALDGCHTPTVPAPAASATPPPPSKARKITLNVNGQPRELELEPRVSLLDALRERLNLTGSKKGCDHGQCGACTVLVGGKRVNACLTLAVMVGDAPITTIEGLAQGEQPHAMQAAFVEEDALQCGYCTPGQIMSALGLVKENRAHTDAEVREHMSGNICRCGAYPNILAAIQKARAASASG
jgi:xanthine dehydrogenase YagT iron-sulfur-binding subunit